jgi:hypothetical protein
VSCFEEVVGEVEYLLMLDRGRKIVERGGFPTLGKKVCRSSGCNYRWQGLGQGQGQVAQLGKEEEQQRGGGEQDHHQQRRKKTGEGFLSRCQLFQREEVVPSASARYGPITLKKSLS